MCRLYGFRSSVLSGVHRSLVQAENALSRQSERHKDGWGVAFYVDRFPQLVKSDKQALSDGLFSEVSAVVSTRTLLAHIRAATVGKINVLNCHPFQYGPWTFAHNGEVVGFGKHEVIRNAVLERIAPQFRKHILGSTDSEAAFCVFLTELNERTPDLYGHIELDVVLDALRATVDFLRAASEPHAGEPARLTFLLTNGSVLVGYRHVRELFFSTHKTRCPERDDCPAYVPGKCEAPATRSAVNHLVVTSERIAENPNVWYELEDGEFAAVDAAMTFRRGRLSEVGAALPPRADLSLVI